MIFYNFFFYIRSKFDLIVVASIYYILPVLFLLLTLIQLYYLLGYFSRVSYYKKKAQPGQPVFPVSIVISARNEAENLRLHLPSVLEQQYPDFEVIVVNDCSYDLSSDVLKEMKLRYDHLKIVEIQEDDRFKHGKKFALTLGIKAAKNEHLLFTDADCAPMSTNWLFSMQQAFEKKEIVLGYSPYFRRKGFLNACARFETFFTAIQYFGFALRKNAYMGVGRNLAYTKSIFFRNKGFAAHMHVLSGDDDLFVNQNATPGNVSVNLDPDSFVITEAKQTYASYFRQRLRHMSAGKLYRKNHIYHLTMIAVSGWLFYLLFILLLFTNFKPEITLGIFAVRFIAAGILYYPAMKRLRVGDLWWWYPFLEFIYFLVIPVWAIVGFFRKQRKWN